MEEKKGSNKKIKVMKDVKSISRNIFIDSKKTVMQDQQNDTGAASLNTTAAIATATVKARNITVKAQYTTYKVATSKVSRKAVKLAAKGTVKTVKLAVKGTVKTAKVVRKVPVAYEMTRKYGRRYIKAVSKATARNVKNSKTYKVGSKKVRVLKRVEETYGKKGVVVSVTKKSIKKLKKTPVAKKIANSVVGKGVSLVIKVGKKTVKVAKDVNYAYDILWAYHFKLNKKSAAALYRAFGKKPVDNIKLYFKTFFKGFKKTEAWINGPKGFELKCYRPSVNRILYTVQDAGKVALHTAKFGASAALHTAKFGANASVNLVGAVGDSIAGNDFSSQAASQALKTAQYTGKGSMLTVKTGVKTVKAAKNTGKGVLKIGKSFVKFVKSARSIGIKATAKKAVKKVAKKAGKKAVQAFTKFLLKHTLIPILVCIILLLTIFSIISTVTGAVAAIFAPVIELGEEVAGIFSVTSYNEDEFIRDQVIEKRADLINELRNTYENSSIDYRGPYHIVRFYNQFTHQSLALTDENFEASMLPTETYIDMMQPIFHTVMLSEYGGKAKKSDAKELCKELWESLNDIECTEQPTEYCQMNVLPDGDVDNPEHEIEQLFEADGECHAEASCPNHSEQKVHADDIGSPLCSCDHWYWTCNGHKGSLSCGKSAHSHSSSCYNKFGIKTCGKSAHSHSDWHSASNSGCYSTTYHNGELASDCGNATKHKGCDGYYVCLGHSVLRMELITGSLDQLIEKYYTDPIAELEQKQTDGTITADEKAELRDKKDYYEICMEYIKVLVDEYGFNSAYYSNIQETPPVNIEDATGEDIAAFALTFNGGTYVWGGADPRPGHGADCSGLVMYVYNHFGVSLPHHAATQANYGKLVSSLDEAQPGDLIFYSKNGSINHVAIYIGDGQIINAGSTKTGIHKNNATYRDITVIKRIIN